MTDHLLNILLIDDNYYQQLVKRNKRILSQLRDGLDQAILPHLDLINQHPDVVTVFSCSGHPESEDPGKRNYRDTTYFLCAVRSHEGLTFLHDVRVRWARLLRENEVVSSCGIRLSHVDRYWRFRHADGTESDMPYTAAILSGKIKRDTQEHVLKYLEEALKESLDFVPT